MEGIFILLAVMLVVLMFITFELSSIARLIRQDFADMYEYEREQIADEREENEDVRDQLSETELALLARDEEFEQRITRMKQELASVHTVRHNPTIAEESHPHVKNLPHNIIPDVKSTLPDVEYAE